jgi:beta-lactam-binding protein with PASTA domain
MKDIFGYIKSKLFLKHLLVSLVSLVVFLWILSKLLNLYTDHGKIAEVPDFKGKSIQELDAFITDKKVNYIIIDSIYNPEEKPGIVIKQDPEPKSTVKHNRTIYLYVTSLLPPQIAMPKLVDRSRRQALLMIESYGLKVGKIREVKGDCVGCVLRQLFNGKEIVPGEPIKKGSEIDLEIGKQEDRLITTADSTNQMTEAEEN